MITTKRCPPSAQVVGCAIIITRHPQAVGGAVYQVCVLSGLLERHKLKDVPTTAAMWSKATLSGLLTAGKCLCGGAPVTEKPVCAIVCPGGVGLTARRRSALARTCPAQVMDSATLRQPRVPVKTVG